MNFLTPLYEVDLIHGDIIARLEENNIPGPYSYYESFHKTNYISLGICLQNMCEQDFKNGKNSAVIGVDRHVFGELQSVNRNRAIQTRKELQEHFPEDFI